MRYFDIATTSVNHGRPIRNCPIPQIIGKPTNSQKTVPRGSMGLEQRKQKV